MRLRVLYFASLRERLGIEREEIELPENLKTCGDARSWLSGRGGVWAGALNPDGAESVRNLRMALNQRIAHDKTALEEGAELAFFPPVTGG